MHKINKVVCAISGGVDSAVSAWLLKKRGFDVCGVFMRNWDIRDELGHCSSDSDRENAQYVCRHLDIPLIEKDFVKEYWSQVFMPMVAGYTSGCTPNPDILCNRYIKFGAFFNYATQTLSADAVATGHYARNSAGQFLQHLQPDEHCLMLTGTDPVKDQTLFLSQVNEAALRQTMFPIGGLMKYMVKDIARSIGLQQIADKKESMGVCFIGKRNFNEFIDDYVDKKPGNFVRLDTGEVVGKHNGIHHYTRGQRSQLGGLRKALFISHWDTETQDIYVVEGTDHPALFSTSLYTGTPHWISGCEPEELTQTDKLHCSFRYQHIHPLSCADLHRRDTGEMHLQLSKPYRAITQGQYAVFYSGDVCLGSASITRPGPSLYTELQKSSPTLV